MGLGRGFGRGRGSGNGRGRGAFSGYSCVKFAFFAFNVIFWLLGCAVLGIGIWLQVSKGSYASIIPNVSFLGASVLCITAGILILIIGFFGCCGAIMENQCMLLTYFILVIIIFILETVISVLAFVYRRRIEKTVKEQLLVVIKEKWSETDEEGWQEGWAYTHQTFNCCGVNNYTDWYNIKAWPNKERVPQECCRVEKDECHVEGHPGDWYQQGCLNQLKKTLESELYIVGITCIVVVLIQIFGMAAAIAMFCCLRSEKYYYE